MSKILISLSLFLSVAVFAADEVPAKTKVFGKAYFDWTANLKKNATDPTAFNLKRSYFGAKHTFADKAAAVKLTLDVGQFKSVDAKDKETTRTYVYAKTAQLTLKKLLPLTELTLGLHGLRQFKVQEDFWGHRYLYKSFMDQNKYGSSADLGGTALVKVGNTAKVHVSLLNGEGYKKPQLDKEQKGAFGIELSPIKALTVFAYGDIMPVTAKENQITVAGFIGYKLEDVFRLGAEYNVQLANKGVKDGDLTGISAYGIAPLGKVFELFGRFDMLSSKEDWNQSKDGQAIIAGVQASPFKGYKVALNFQGWQSAADGAEYEPKVAVHNEFKF